MWSKAIKHGTESFLKNSVLLLAVLCLVFTVILPLFTLFIRSVSDDIPVTIWGADEVRAGGRVLRIHDGVVDIDGAPAVLHDGMINGDGVEAHVTAGEFAYIEMSKVLIHGVMTDIHPIVIEKAGGSWSIDKVMLPDDDYRRDVSRYIGFGAFRRQLTGSGFIRSLLNSLFVSVMAASIAVLFAFIYSYALTRSRIPFRPLFRLIAMAPLFAPTMLYGLSLVYLFGNKGAVTTGFMGIFPRLAFDIDLYGPAGIIMAEIVYIFPASVLILSAALSHMDKRVYEAATVLGASPVRVFFTITLPGVRLALFNAVTACFILAFTDFGAPKIVGGGYNVLATEIYQQVAGQHRIGAGAVVSIMMLLPSLIAFIFQRITERRQASMISARSVLGKPEPSGPRDGVLFIACLFIAGYIILLLLTATLASLMRLWPYDISLTLSHYQFKGMGGGGYTALWNSVRMSFHTAMIGAFVTFICAYLVEKGKGSFLLRRAIQFVSMLPMALPGLVIGIMYILFFNQPSWFGVIANPLHCFYDSMALLVLSNIIHFFTVAYLTASSALNQMDPEIESVGASLGASPFRMLRQVTFPICLPVISEIWMYYFVSSMATVSAVVFLYGPATPLASVAVVSMDDSGATASASAMCMLIVTINLAVRGAYEFLNHVVLDKARKWRNHG